MRLIVGLGNPGEQYEHTRHNAGFDAVDDIAESLRVSYWKRERGALTARVKHAGEDVLLVKPQDFMNTSGGPLKKVMAAYEVGPDDIVVVHDDLDIEPGAIRVKFGGGLAGHNGLKSIADKLQTRDFARVRIGIGRPPGRMQVVDWVLTRPKKEAADDFSFGVHRGAEAALFYLENGLEKTQQKFN